MGTLGDLRRTALLDIDLSVPADAAASSAAAMRWSSCELHAGVQVEEQAFDTLPGVLQMQLLDEQSRKRRNWLDDDTVNPFTGRPRA